MTAPETTAAALVERVRRLKKTKMIGTVGMAIAYSDALDLLDAFCALAAQPPTDGGWEPTHRHVKRGSDYQAMGTAHVQISTDDPIQEDDVLMIYRDKAGQLWARRDSEFFDGRFAPLPVRPDQGEVK